MPAFHRVPQVLRDRLAGMTGNKTRLIGGSADTLYFPGRCTFLLVPQIYVGGPA